MHTAFRVALISGAAIMALTPALANHSWGNYHWARTQNPVTLTVNEALTSNWEGHLSTALTDWDRSAVLAFTASSPKPSSASAKRCSAIAGQILVCNAAYGQRGWLGIASIWANGSHITQATVKVNDTYFSMPQYNTAAWRQFVMCQEVGHDFGLDHQDENFNNANLGTCMDYTNNPSTNTKPNQHDYDQLAEIYKHLDSTNTAINSTATNFGLREPGKPAAAPREQFAGDSMAEWGRAIRSDAQGRPNVFERDLGGGHKVITHVLWAIGERAR